MNNMVTSALLREHLLLYVYSSKACGLRDVVLPSP